MTGERLSGEFSSRGERSTDRAHHPTIVSPTNNNYEDNLEATAAEEEEHKQTHPHIVITLLFNG